MRCEVTDDSVEQTAKLEQVSLQKTPCYGIFGIVELATGPYLVLIQSASILGQIVDCDVFRVESLMYIPINNAVPPLTM